MSPSQTMFINAGHEDQMGIVGYKTHQIKRAITWVFIILTLGLLRLVFYWRPDWMVQCMCSSSDLQTADHVILTDPYDQTFVEDIETVSGADGSVDDILGGHTVSESSDLQDDAKIRLTTEKPHETGVMQRYFINKKIKYCWNYEVMNYTKLCGIEDGRSCSYFHSSSGLTETAQESLRSFYGENVIDVQITPIFTLLYTQILHPFYIFQLFSCCLWFADEYYYYAATILVISIISLTTQIYETRSMQTALKNTLSPIEMISRVRNGEFEVVPGDRLVPGDVIEVPRQGCVMQCDAVLVTGNCIVNESMLTGESVPVTKTPIPQGRGGPTCQDIVFDIKDHSRHVLFSGTRVIQTRYYGSQRVTAVVIRTGFATAKGELIRSILFPKPVDFKFTQDGIKFIGCLAVIALGGMIYTIILMIDRGDDVSSIIIRTLDLVTIVIPPALPAAMTIGIVFAQKRLRKAKVFCISPRSINLCGAINVFCFDKTGTLTEDGLDMYGVVLADEATFQQEQKVITSLDWHSRMLVAMATCHSLTIIDGEITGDPLDLKMFESTDWNLEEPGEDNAKYDIIVPTVVRPKYPIISNDQADYSRQQVVPYEIGILRQFTFSSKLQRMSVIVRELSGEHFELYAKGSPEMIVALCLPASVPANFHTLLTQYTQQGYRVIGLAHKNLSKLTYVKLQRAQREEVECDMTFLGLLIMENRLKPETTPIIRVLKTACIRTVMVTGDNVMTALSVARDCDMIGYNEKVVMVTALPPSGSTAARLEWTHTEDNRHNKGTDIINVDGNDVIHFSITGKSWAVMRKHFPEILPKLAVWGTVFSRFSPEQKQQLIEALQDIGYYVGMCGDGANDCGALKSAHAGISLSEAEASVASPFTSKEQNISCVPSVIREGRAALVTSYGIFKFMACYSMTQFFSVCIVYWFGANMTDFTFLYVDLVLLTTLGITFCYNAAYEYLDPVPPRVSLIALAPILSLAFQLLVNLACQVAVWQYTMDQPWFEEFEDNDDNDYQCYEVTVVFLSSSFQYVIMAVVFSKGAPYRTSMFRNYWFLGNLLICTFFNVYISMYPFDWIVDLLELRMPPTLAFRGIIVGVGCINFFVCFILETYILDFIIEDKCLQRLRERFINSQLPYRLLDAEMKLQQPAWPPVSRSTTTLADLLRLENLLPDADAVITSGEEKENEAFIYEELEMSRDIYSNMSAKDGGKDNKAFQMDDLANNKQNSSTTPATKNGTAKSVIKVKEMPASEDTSRKNDETVL